MARLWIPAAIALALDQASKYWAVRVLGVSPSNPVDVFPPLLNFRYGENRGVNFGLLGDRVGAWALAALALLICAGVLWWARRRPRGRLADASAGLLVGGALANALDRLRHGFVQDFLNMSCCGVANPFVFNLADVFIFAGAAGIAFLGRDGPAREKGA